MGNDFFYFFHYEKYCINISSIILNIFNYDIQHNFEKLNIFIISHKCNSTLRNDWKTVFSCKTSNEVFENNRGYLSIS